MSKLSPEMVAAMKAIMLTTGDLPGCVPIDLVFAPTQFGKLGSDSLQAAFEHARDGLRLAAVALGAHAVVGCRIEHTLHGQTAHDLNEAWRDTSVFSVVAYGTAVRRQA